jgi:hypothetical protein
MNPTTAQRTLNTAQKNDRPTTEAQHAATRGSGNPAAIIQEIEYGRAHNWPNESLKRLVGMASAWRRRSEPMGAAMTPAAALDLAQALGAHQEYTAGPIHFSADSWLRFINALATPPASPNRSEARTDEAYGDLEYALQALYAIAGGEEVIGETVERIGDIRRARPRAAEAHRRLSRSFKVIETALFPAPNPPEAEGESTRVGEALMKLSRYAHTAAHMSERDMRVQLADIADQLIALAQGSAIREHQHA